MDCAAAKGSVDAATVLLDENCPVDPTDKAKVRDYWPVIVVLLIFLLFCSILKNKPSKIARGNLYSSIFIAMQRYRGCEITLECSVAEDL